MATKRMHAQDNMEKYQTDRAKRILDKADYDRLGQEAEQAYRDFVESINRSKEADMERSMMLR